MADAWTITHRERDEVKLNPDGSVREVTTITFWIGSHGPFVRTFDRGTPAFEVERVMTDKREELRKRDTL